ncbi:MAG: protein kinase [Planctomycetes bacterium]|nr:protein kinase [Planctomycetota bacterium]
MDVRQQDNRYGVKREFREDPLGTLQLCVEQKSRQLVFFRQIRRELLSGPNDLERFQQAVDRLSKVRMNGVLQVRSSGVANSQAWLTTDATDGETLRERLGNGRLGPGTAVRILRGVAESLDKMHPQGFVYGCVCPEALFFDEGSQLWLGEFASLSALCAWDGERHPVTWYVLENLLRSDYLAPEVVANKAFEGKADQFALAAVLCECLSGKRPVEHLAPEDNWTSIRDCLLKKSRLPPEVVDVIAQGLAEDPTKRFDTCVALIDATAKAFAQVRRHKRRKLAKLLLVLIACVSGCTVLHLVLQFRKDAQLRHFKQERTQEIARAYEVEIKTIADVPIDRALKDLKPEETSEAERLLVGKRRSKAESLRQKAATDKAQFQSQLSRFKTYFKPDFRVAFAEAPIRATEGDLEQAKIAFLHSDGKVEAKGRFDSKLTWMVTVDVSQSMPPPCDLRFSAHLDGPANQQAASDEKRIPRGVAGQYQLTGEFTNSEQAWSRGDSFTLRVSLATDAGIQEWSSTKKYSLGFVRYAKNKVTLKPDQVMKATGFTVGTGITLIRRDLYRIEVTGGVTPFEDSFYKKYLRPKTKAEPIDSKGLSNSLVRADFDLVSNDQPVAALLVKVGASGNWARLLSSTIVRAEGLAEGGEIFLSINSVTKSKKNPTPKPSQVYWKSSGAFEVTVQSWSLVPDTLGSVFGEPAKLQQLID